MERLRNTPIRGKMTVIMLLTAGVALVVATIASAILERRQFYQNRTVSLSAMADILAINSDFALSINDSVGTERVLSALKADADIQAASIYDVEGVLVASYRRDGAEEGEEGLIPASVPDDVLPRMEWQSIELTRPVMFDGQRIGTIYLQSGTTGIHQRLFRHGIVLVLVLVGSLVAAYILSVRLQRVISQPIVSLARAAKRVTDEKDYSVRVEKPGEDELGLLTDAFNGMLAAMESQKQVLENTNVELDKRVRNRTAELKSREEELRLTVSGAKVGTWNWNVKTGELQWSDRCREFFELGNDVEPSYERFLEVLHPDDRDRTDQMVREALEKGMDFETEYRVLRPGGAIRWVEALGAATYNAKKEPLIMRGIVLDITERKEAQSDLEEHARNLERSNRELDSFAYVASHDLKSPLRAIKNLANWIGKDCEDVLPEESRTDLHLLQERVERMEALLDALLQYSKVGRKEDEPELIDVNEIVKVLAEMQDVPEGFEIVAVSDLPQVYAPKGALYRVFGNLIGNAVKHHDRPDGRIEISSRPVGGDYEFLIADDGPGIPEQFHERIFKMFQRLKPNHADGHDSNGMGLTLVKKTVELHGGSVHLESAEGEGAKFRFTWPGNHSD